MLRHGISLSAFIVFKLYFWVFTCVLGPSAKGKDSPILYLFLPRFISSTTVSSCLDSAPRYEMGLGMTLFSLTNVVNDWLAAPEIAGLEELFC